MTSNDHPAPVEAREVHEARRHVAHQSGRALAKAIAADFDGAEALLSEALDRFEAAVRRDAERNLYEEIAKLPHGDDVIVALGGISV